MDEEENPNAVSSTWPPPPPFWKSFTPENVSRIAELRKQAAAAAEDGTSTKEDHRRRPSNLPPSLPVPKDLRHLQAPPEPESGTWRVFGAQYRLAEELPQLEEQGVRRLFPNPDERDQDGKHFDRATILKRLAKSLLLNFLELAGIFAMNPGAAEDKISDIRDLFINFHHLINEYRPHQARESLIAMMQAQLDRTRAETDAIRDAKEKVERVLEGLGSLKIDDDDDDADDDAYGLHANNEDGSGGGGVGGIRDHAYDYDGDDVLRMDPVESRRAGGRLTNRDSELWMALASGGELV